MDSETSRRVCLALDASSASHHAWEWVVQHKEIRPADQVYLLNVCEPISSVDNEVALTAAPLIMPFALLQPPHGDSEEHIKERMEELEKVYGAEAVSRLKIPSTNVHCHVVVPFSMSIAQTIARFCEKFEIDLLIVGSRGLGSFRNTLKSLVGLGSVSNQMLQLSPCPVLVVRPDNTVRKNN